MEWNHSCYQLPRGQSAFLNQSLRPVRPQYWNYDTDDEDNQQVWQRETSPLTNQYTSDNDLAPPPPKPPLKMESSGMSGNSMNGGMLLQSFSSLGMPQLEDSTEIQPFFLPQNTAFTDSQALSPSLPPLPSPPPQLRQQQHQPEQQYGGQLATQLSSPFSEFSTEPAGYYPAPIPLPPAATRSSMDYFSESIPTLHSVHNSVPTLPSSFGTLEQQQQQQQARVVLAGQNVDFGNSVAHDSIFNSPLPMTPADTDTSLQTPLTLPMGNSVRPSHSVGDDTPPNYSPAMAPIGRAKRGGGLIEPFTQMATAHEPKFSPDKRKLCCVEGCKSQARAFNRCKRHGGSKRCSSPGCTKSVQSRGLCIRHGGGSRCQEPGCTRASQSHGRCKMHGGGRPCVVAGCEKKAHLKRLCRRHGGGAKCCVAGCDKWAQRQGMCMTHSKVVATQPTAIGIIGDSVVYERKSSHAPSAPDSSPPPSLRMFTDEVALKRGRSLTAFPSPNSNRKSTKETFKLQCSIDGSRKLRALRPAEYQGMLDTNSSGSRPLGHDAETFRVAEELIMLSSRAASASSMEGKPNGSPSNISGFFEHTTMEEKQMPKVKVKKGRSQRSHISLANRTKSKAISSGGAAHKNSERDGVKQEPLPLASTQSADIINSRCDVSHSELLKEHRVRFRRARRRWNIEQRTKKQEYLARFHVQGIPLVQHLEALTHWR